MESSLDLIDEAENKMGNDDVKLERGYIYYFR